MHKINMFPVNGVTIPVTYCSGMHKLYVDDKEVLTKLRTFENPWELRILFGNQCNMQCGYCQQDKGTFTEKQPDPLTFVRNLERYLSDMKMERILFWGGEPFLYFKQIKEYYKLLKDTWPNARYLICTNGLLFKGAIKDWCIENNIYVTFSFDGPGQIYRGIDPLDDKEVRKSVQEYLDEEFVFYPAPTITNRNKSILEYISFMRQKLNFSDDQYHIATFAPLRAVSDSTLKMQIPDEELKDFSASLYAECFREPELVPQWGLLSRFVMMFCTHLGTSIQENWWCNAFDKHRVIVNMDGNVQKCAFYDYNALDESGEKLGYHNIEGVHVSERERPEFKRWWRNMRYRCWDCPVRQLCQGNCPYAPEKYFRQNCKQMYYYALIGMTLAINHITGMTVKGIEFDIDHYQTIYD